MVFRRPSYFALAALIEGPLHGYAIVRRASELSDDAVRLSTGTLYALLERAIDEGLVVAGEPYIAGGRKRRDYTLTEYGRSRTGSRSGAPQQRRHDCHATIARDRTGGFPVRPRIHRAGCPPFFSGERTGRMRRGNARHLARRDRDFFEYSVCTRAGRDLSVGMRARAAATAAGQTAASRRRWLLPRSCWVADVVPFR